MADLLRDLPNFRSNLSFSSVQEMTGWNSEVMINDYIGIAQQGEFIAEYIDRNTENIEENAKNIAINADNIAKNTALINYNFKYLHGLSDYSVDYDEESGYASGYFVTYEDNEYAAKQEILTPAGAFDPNLWREVSTQGNHSFIRQTRADVNNNFVLAGRGGILSESTVALGTINSSAIDVIGFTKASISNPRYITQNPTSDGLKFDILGTWLVNVKVSIKFTSDALAREIKIRLNNDTKSQSRDEYNYFVTENASGANLEIGIPIEIAESEVGDLFKIQLLSDLDTFAGTENIGSSFSAVLASEGQFL